MLNLSLLDDDLDLLEGDGAEPPVHEMEILRRDHKIPPSVASAPTTSTRS